MLIELMMRIQCDKRLCIEPFRPVVCRSLIKCHEQFFIVEVSNVMDGIPKLFDRSLCKCGNKDPLKGASKTFEKLEGTVW